MPLYIFLIGLISSTLILKSKRSKNFNFFTLFIFAFGFSAIVISEVSVQFISTDILNNLALTLSPIIITLFLYLLIRINLKFG